METTTARLRYVLEVLAPAVSGKKATLPILQNVVVGQGKAYATNLETAIAVDFPEATDDPVLLPHQQLLSLLRNIPGPTRLEVTREGKRVKVVAGGTGAEFPDPGKVADFPPLPKLQPVSEGEVDADLFLKTATAIAEYAATEASRPVLQCVCVTLGAPLEMAGADGFRLAWLTIPQALPALNSPPIPFTRLLVPTTAVDTLARVWKVMEKRPTVDDQGTSDPTKADGKFRMAMLAVAKRTAAIKFTAWALTFHHGAVTVWVQLTQGDFPNYHQLIPTDLPNKVTFDAEEALRAVRFLKDVASAGDDIVRLNWSNSSLTLTSTSKEEGAIFASVRAHVHGKEARIAFNIKYLTGYLAGKLGMVLLETSDPSSKGRFYHAGSPDVLIMPMFVQWGDPAADQPDDDGASAAEVPAEETPAGPESVEGQPAASKPPRRRGGKATAAVSE